VKSITILEFYHGIRYVVEGVITEHLLNILQFISFTLNGKCHMQSALWITCKFSIYYWVEIYGVVVTAL
jgi:hypothetical protein